MYICVFSPLLLKHNEIDKFNLCCIYLAKLTFFLSFFDNSDCSEDSDDSDDYEIEKEGMNFLIFVITNI